MPRFMLDHREVARYGAFHDEEYKGYWGVYHNAVDYIAVFVPLYAWTKLFIDRKYWGTEGGNWLECHDEKGNWFRLAHLKEYKINQGQWVNEGTLLAITGDTGSRVNAAGVTVKYIPHLHAELRVNGERKDIELYFNQLLANPPMPENHAYDDQLIRLPPNLDYALVVRGKKYVYPPNSEIVKSFILLLEKTKTIIPTRVDQATWDSLPNSDGLKF